MDQDHDSEAAVKARAYQIWEEEGRPDGRDHEHWLLAEDEIQAASTSGPLPGEGSDPDDPPPKTELEETAAIRSPAANGPGGRDPLISPEAELGSMPVAISRL